jgi:hypothetical protein
VHDCPDELQYDGEQGYIECTVIPAITNTIVNQEVVTGCETNKHTGDRCREDTFGYNVDGNLCAFNFDCSELAELDLDTFGGCGCGSISYED